MTENRLLQLSAKDNVCAVARAIDTGESITIAGRTVTTEQALPVGFKVANRAIKPGEKIVKCGASIGTATADIGIGEMIHTHNMKSDYLPTFLLDDEDNPFTKEG